MEAGDAHSRQSGIPTAGSHEYLDRRPREQRIDTSYREMATAALVSPAAPYHSHHSSFSSGYHSAPPTSIPGMISPVDSRRASDESEGAPRPQPLPSIQEVISGSKPPSFPPSASAPLPPPSHSLPSPFAISTPRPYGDMSSDKNPSPRTLLPSTASYPPSNPPPAFPDPARPSLLNRPAPPPLNTYPGQHPSPPSHEQGLGHGEPQSYSAGHSHHSNNPPPRLYTPPSRPPGQLPLPQYPISPRNNGPSLPSPFEPQRAPMYNEERDHNQNREGPEYKSSVDRAFESWGYSEILNTVASSARAITHFAESYAAAAREQQSSQPIPSRLPTDNEVAAMISKSIHVVQKLEEVRDIVANNRMSADRSRENGVMRKLHEEEDTHMYPEPVKPTYHMTEVKKRRGRAAPPGRCHSCNRIDTPEWRRGPDGARTLCNACGLHYAKLERRRQLDQRAARPKTAEGRN